MKKLLQLLIFIIAANSSAQVPTFDWAKTFGDNLSNATSVAVDNTGNVYTAGIFKNTGDFDSSSNTFNLTSNGVNDFYITKYDASGASFTREISENW